MSKARNALMQGCALYCSWYDSGKPKIDGGAMAYELVSLMRKALTALNEEYNRGLNDAAKIVMQRAGYSVSARQAIASEILTLKQTETD